VLATFPIRFPDQLRQHLRALRKARGLTQSQLGARVGVSQARIAEIEANPGLVNFEQLVKLLSVLGVTVSLVEEVSTPNDSESRQSPAKPQPSSPRPKTRGAPGAGKGAPPTSGQTFVVRPKKGSW